MDIVEELRKLRGPYVWQAADEIERLREALNNILAVKYYGEEGGWMESDSMKDIARAALKEGE